MKSMPNLSKDDQLRVQSFAQQAAEWFRLFDCFNPSAIGYPPAMSLADRLDIIFALHRLTDFRDYVRPFLKDDTRIEAFEDAVAEAVYAATLEQVSA